MSETNGRPSIEERTEGLVRADGLFSFWWDEAAAKLLLEVSSFDEPFLYFWGLTTGVGSVDVGLDRGSVQGSAVARMRRAGDRVLVEVENLAFRAGTDNAELVRSVRESFADAVIAALPVEAVTGKTAVVDATPLLIRDVCGVARAVKRASLGEVKLDERRSVVFSASCKAFPSNTELEAMLTFSGDELDRRLAAILPDGRTMTVRQHHSLTALPEPGYRPRTLDPRVGFGARSFQDFAARWDEPLERRWISRWRLEKQDPHAHPSPPKRPIVFHLDGGIPEPIRSAMREGALWWNEAFEAAGFTDALRVEDLPDGADPLDARYSVIQWVHRADRGWSVGASWSDPRTGEILCARPRMDSHRVRTVDAYWRAATPADPDVAACCQFADPAGDLALTTGSLDDAEQVMLRRIALLTCHEVGHTLGLPHNFGASRYGRGSVMEYFTPRIGVRQDGTLDLSDAYMHGLGAWDVHAITWAYGQHDEAAEASALEAIAVQGVRDGIDFVPSSDPRYNPYDDGPDVLAHLSDTMATRRALLQTFGARHLRAGDPVADLDTWLSIVYLFHRFALEAAVKLVGGMEHAHALWGDGQVPTEIVSGEVQREALSRLLDALEPAELEIPESILAMLPPPPFGARRSFDASTARAGYAFDQLAAARIVADLVLVPLFDRERCARVAAFATRRADAPGLREVMQATLERTSPEPQAPARKALARVVQRAVADRLMRLVAQEEPSPEVRAEATDALREIRRVARMRSEAADASVARSIAHDVERFLESPAEWTPRPAAPPAPPGAPVG